MGHALNGVTVEEFVATLRAAVDNLDVVQPAGLRAPLSLWLRGFDERVRRERWTDLLGRPVAAEWEAARAVLAAADSGTPR